MDVVEISMGGVLGREVEYSKRDLRVMGGWVEYNKR